MLRKSFFVLLAMLSLLFGTVSPTLAYPPTPPGRGGDPHTAPLNVNTWRAYSPHPGEALGCLARRSGLSWETFAQANGMLHPGALARQSAVYLPQHAAEVTVLAARQGETALELAARHNLSSWEIAHYNALPLYSGADVALPTATEPAACLPYPLLHAELTTSTLVRGRTAVLTIETAEPAACEVAYAGQVAPCYALDDTRLYALIGISALAEPGEYDLDVRLQARGLETAWRMPLTVTAGWYGFQFIDPPAALNALMDANLMNGELDYLELWRVVRTPERLWELPLAFPLPFRADISADYGARRSYGGMVDGYHSGIDYRVWSGVPVSAPADGVVLLAEKLVARGNAVLIDHGGGLITGYWHLSRIDVEVGQHVTRGEAFAAVGNTGLSTGAHLHWDVWVNGVSVDGKQWLEADGLGAVEFPPLEP